ncbi:MAG: class I SAM-dependent methyltransferase [Kofleriaceae bacterium]
MTRSRGPGGPGGSPAAAPEPAGSPERRGARAAAAPPVAPRSLRPRRYQLRKEAVGVVLRGAPWIFRDHLSSAAQVFSDGQWLELVDGQNRVIGYGSYEARGAIAIRVLRRGAEAPDAAWLAAQVRAALARRAPLRADTDALRAIHGESDGIPAVVVDVFGGTAVAQSYAAGSDALARLAGRWVADELGVPRLLWRAARRRQGAAEVLEPPRWLRGGGRGDAVETFREGALTFACDPTDGQKSGAYLDLRGLRRAVAGLPLAGARVLNLFAYTGMLGRCAERAGAAEIVQVDASAAALAVAARHHVDDERKHTRVVADVFAWLPAQPAAAFELVIVDPPAMASRRAQVPRALAAYRRLYRAAATQVAPGGTLVAACCTSRITRAEFEAAVAGALGTAFERTRELPPELDHPVTFAEADYLKVSLWTRTRPS